MRVIGVAAACVLSVACASADEARSTRIVGTPGDWRLHRNGEAYFVRGAGGSSRLEELKAAGGNSFRTWTTRGLEPKLAEAERLGLSVLVGLDLVAARKGFDYGDEKGVRAKIERVVGEVEKHKAHPAILAWGLGNELELNIEAAKQDDIWRALELTAQGVKRADPSRPTVVIVAHIYGGKAARIAELCPSCDILGVNAYGSMDRVPAMLAEQGWTKAYMVTEFGPRGYWEVEKTAWGAPIEPIASVKADTYARNYAAAVADSANPERTNCVGSYAFLWGHKQERTHTWFGMFLPAGDRLPAVDAMTRAWTGAWPANRSPRIASLKLEPGATLTAGQEFDAAAPATDPDGDELSYSWEVLRESTSTASGGDPEDKPALLDSSIITGEGGSARVRAPDKPGPYRLFVYVRDGRGNADTANVPILVEEREGLR